MSAPRQPVMLPTNVAARRLFTINGSPIVESSVSLLLAAVEQGARDAGGEAHGVQAIDLKVTPCVACGPEPTTGWCIFHDDMDQVYEGIAQAHAVVVGSPVFFDTVSGPLKQVMDRCNCMTMLMRVPGGGYEFRPQLARTRRAAFVTACSTRHRYDLAERSVRGFFKWVGAKWEETLAWQHDDNDRGSVTDAPEMLERARALGRRLIESPPLQP